MSIFLIGYRGSGKTSVGKRLADRLWQSFVDADAEVVKRANMTIRQIFEQCGEPHFRDLESQVVADLAKLQEHVVALGGGAVLREQNRQAIQGGGHKVIYLKCDPAELHKRIQADTATAETRPALTTLGGGVEEVEKLLAEREPIYRQMATAELDVTNLTPEEAVVRVVRLA
ncbi:MAG TPA: shikimate kinase [Tepidisphaeraceae bacterium]|nr:shikimate kinase [Tepidisphaeraceae bacterium]